MPPMLSRSLLFRAAGIMNRPHNRQPRPSRGNESTSGRGRGGNRMPQNRNGPTWRAGTPQQAAGTVPTLQQVIPGASVFIILKEDQPTGRETHGLVQELLTKGNHPRGIKVRLRGGLVGRVQRMGEEIGVGLTRSDTAAGASVLAPTQELNGSSSTSASATQNSRQSPLVGGGRRGFGTSRIKYRDIREEEYGIEEPPQRSLADYLPAQLRGHGAGEAESSAPAAKCPFCEDFEGDEVAVSYHVEQKHLS